MPSITPTSSDSSFLNQVQVGPTSTASAAASNPTASTTGTSQLGEQDFLKLLMAEMQNQDPSQPMDDTQTITQMAQFSALQATEQLTTTLQQSSNIQTLFSAGALIGKYVSASQADGSTISGAVTGVDLTSSNGSVTPALVVNGQDVDYTTINSISSTPISSTGSSSTSSTSTPSTSSTSSTSTPGSGSSPSTSGSGTSSRVGTSSTNSTTGSSGSSAVVAPLAATANFNPSTTPATHA